ncbi:MAG: hypothetical protein ACTSQE_08340 [Candidatus Heimdallarchaeaceae archaeon]
MARTPRTVTKLLFNRGRVDGRYSQEIDLACSIEEHSSRTD